MGVYEDRAKNAGHDYGTYDNEEYAQMLEAMDAASRHIAELEAELAEQKEWVSDLADLNVKNEDKLAVVRDIVKSVIFNSHSEVVDKMCKIRSALSDPVSRDNGDNPDKVIVKVEERCFQDHDVPGAQWQTPFTSYNVPSHVRTVTITVTES